MHDLVWGRVHSLALLLMSRALSVLWRAKKACRARDRLPCLWEYASRGTG